MGDDWELQRLPISFDSPAEYEKLEARIRDAFRREIYGPILREFFLSSDVLRNSLDKLADAIRSGRITYSRGSFRGRFNSGISKELRSLGARWDRKTSSFKIEKRKLPIPIRAEISASLVSFQEKLAAVDKRLSQILPEDFADSIKMKDIFEKSLWKTDNNLAKTLKAITIEPKISPSQRDKIAAEWARNMRLSIKGFTESQIRKLRIDIEKSYFAGQRYESAIKSIQKSYGVSANKAKFLARQEYKLLTAKFKETRYAEAGIYEYEWRCVAGSKNHPVRPSHKKLEGRVFRFDDPPVTTPPGEPARRNNPGEDYNCRCFAIPVVRKRKKPASR